MHSNLELTVGSENKAGPTSTKSVGAEPGTLRGSLLMSTFLRVVGVTVRPYPFVKIGFGAGSGITSSTDFCGKFCWCDWAVKRSVTST